MSPEQVVGAKNIDYRTDLWSLGVVAYEALTGQRPFYGETMGALALKIHRDPLPRPTGANPALPSAVDAWFARACAREPDERFASAKEMADALVAALRDLVPAGLSTDSGRTPKPIGLETTQADAGPLFRSASDARSETGAGVGLASQKVAASSRARWILVAGIAAGAIGVGFIVPRLTRSEAPKTGPELPSAAAAASPTPTLNPTATPTSTATPTATSTSTPTPTPTATPTFRPRPRPAAATSATPSLASAKPASPATDDDIK